MRDNSAELFANVVDALKTTQVRPEVVLSEVPAPRRIAPHAIAFSAEVLNPKDADDVLGTGRFVVLHDPAGQDAWQGTWRVVSFARADLESEMATDPALSAVGWSWLTESLHTAGANFSAEAGTVTRVVNESFGVLSTRPSSVELEIRASWTPSDTDLPRHLGGWSNLLATLAGMPPLPDGVRSLPGVR